MNHVLLILAIFLTTASATFVSLKKEAEDFREWQIGLRRWLHQHAELKFEEFKTSKYIQDVSQSMQSSSCLIFQVVIQLGDIYHLELYIYSTVFVFQILMCTECWIDEFIIHHT